MRNSVFLGRHVHNFFRISSSRERVDGQRQMFLVTKESDYLSLDSASTVVTRVTQVGLVRLVHTFFTTEVMRCRSALAAQGDGDSGDVALMIHRGTELLFRTYNTITVPII